MLFSNLPQEIIEKIIDLLSLEDRISCYLVCKSWKGVFQDSLHSDLYIHSKILWDLVHPSQDNHQPYLSTRLLVRYLRISHYARTKDEELYALQTTFPNIKYIHFNPHSISPDSFGVTADWTIWKSMRELHISFGDSSIPDIKDKLIEILPCLPILSRLEIVNTDIDLVEISFSLDDIETIHSHLKDLGHLKLYTNLLTLSESDLERMTNVLPATKIGSLTIGSGNTDNRWLAYIARKYPNLRTLEFFSKKDLPNTEQQRNNAIESINNLPLAFKHLTKLNFQYLCCIEKECLVFWDMVLFHNIPLKNISIRIIRQFTNDPSDNIYDLPKNITEICLSKFSRTIESFSLRCDDLNLSPIDFTEIGSNLYNLVKLEIKSPTSVEIDTLLCQAPHLKSLSLNCTKIKVKDEFYNSNRFELESFKIHDADITSDVLRFLSFHCRDLNELGLSKTSVKGDFTTPGCQLIDMTCSRLKILSIERTEFVIKDDKECSDNWNVTLISRPYEDIPPNQDHDPKVLPVITGKTSINTQCSWLSRYYKYMMNKMQKRKTL